MQGRNRDTDVENKRMDTKGGKWRRGGGVMNWAIGIDMYTHKKNKTKQNKTKNTRKKGLTSRTKWQKVLKKCPL